jgi:hypothetical protein
MALSPEQKVLAKTLAWRQGNLRYLLKPSQRKIYDRRSQIVKESRKFVNCCGRGWGKSFLLFALCIENALKHPGSDAVFVAPVLRKLSEYLEPIARACLADCPEELRPEFSTATLTYKFPNGSRIIVCGSNQKAFDNIRGGTFKLAVVDEGAYHDYLIELIERVLMPALNKGNGHLVLSSTPPDTEHPFDQRYCTEAELSGYYFHADIYEAGYPADQIEEFKREAGWIAKESAGGVQPTSLLGASNTWPSAASGIRTKQLFPLGPINTCGTCRAISIFHSFTLPCPSTSERSTI